MNKKNKTIAKLLILSIIIFFIGFALVNYEIYGIASGCFLITALIMFYIESLMRNK